MKRLYKLYKRIACILLAFVFGLVVACSNSTTPDSTANKPAESPVASSATSLAHDGGHSTSKKVNINNAILSELDKLEGKLGIPALSNKIQSSRPYTKTEDLVSKKVIDQAQFDKIKDMVTIEDIQLTGAAKDIDYMIKLGLMKGHLLVAKELLDLKKIDQAEPHIGHPVEEIYADVADQLTERKVKEFKTPLIALHDQVKAGGKDTAKLNADFSTSMKSVEEAIAGLPATQRSSASFVLQVITGLLDSANSEYGAAVAQDKIAQAVEYQDSRGFVVYSQELFKSIQPQLTKSNASIATSLEKSLTDLSKAWPSPIPPAAPVLPVAEVTKLIKSIESESAKIGQPA
jgi:DNA uptake protein ComE-like DNA-binding protein